MSVTISINESDLASQIALHNGRTGVIVSQLKIPALAAKRVFKAVTGRTPSSGLLPSSSDLNYSSIQRLHTSLIMAIYESCLKRVSPSRNINQLIDSYEHKHAGQGEIEYKEALQLRCVAFLSAYNTYLRITGDSAKIDINRFNFLIRDLYVTSNLNTPKSIINWSRCKSCKARLLKNLHEVTVKCPHCSDSISRSKNLITAFREKQAAFRMAA